MHDQDCMHLWYRAAPGEEVYSFRQITQYAAFTPDTLSSIASALKAFGIWQVGDCVLLLPWTSLLHMCSVSQSCCNVSSLLLQYMTT